MRPSLIVFIDCFPRRFAGADFLPALAGRAEIRPGFGYSVNIVAELFAGKTPDDLGTFNIFGYNPDNTWLAAHRGWLRLLAPVRRSYLADRVAHRLLARRAGYVGNIPFQHIGYFERTGAYPFSPEFPYPTIFSDPHFRGSRVFHSDLKGVLPPHRDAQLIERARRAVRPGESIFLSLSDLDAAAHAHGVGTPEFMARIADYDAWLGDLIDRFMAANPDGFVSVLSDHGAENTHGAHDMGVERHLGPASPRRYMYFLDATLARFWVADPALHGEVAEFLAVDPRGRLVTEEERAEYGLRNRAFGDYIWVVDEGYGISPSFLGRGVSKALHGYHPELESQQALFLTSAPLDRARYPSVDVFGALCAQMELEIAGAHAAA